MTEPARKRIVIAVLDGLRADFVTPDAMPFLHGLKARGARPGRFHPVFPTSTRVNAAALGSGAHPAASGIVANRFVLPELFGDRLFHTGKQAHIDAAERHFGGRLIQTPTLGETLAHAGLSMAVVSSGSAGTTHMTHPKAAELGHLRLCLSRWESSTPTDVAARLLSRFGPIAEVVFPNAARMRQQTDIFLDGVVHECDPDVSVHWYNDPDHTFHYRGLGSPEALGALRAVDAEVARLAEWAGTNGRPTDLIVVSDHGHITAARPLPLDSLLEEAGIHADPARASGPFSGLAGYVSLMTCRTGDRRDRDAALEWLVGQGWCGPVFARRGAFSDPERLGVQDLGVIGLDHPRTPDLIFMLNGNEKANAEGIPGSCVFQEKVPVGGSLHGGLNPWETNAFFLGWGPSFAAGRQGSRPAGIADVTPTVLGILGLAPASGMTGRVLHELLADPAEPGGEDTTTTDSAVARSADGTRCQTVRRSICAGRIYLHSATASGPEPRVLP